MEERDSQAMGPAENVKDQAQRLLDSLPEDASWDDVLYRVVVRREIELGLADSDADRVTPVEEVMREFGIRDE